MTTTRPQNAYLVASGTGTLYPTVILARDPTLNDLNGPNGQKFQVTQRWVNSVTDKEWFLLNFITTQGYYQANWVQIAGGSAMTETLTGNSGGAVPPTGNNINVVGDGTTISVAGNPATSTLTISAIGSGILETLTGNTGGAISPTAGNINTLGTGSITIAGSGSTLTTQLTGLTNHNVLVGAGTATITNVAPSTAGFVLTSNGASADPSFQDIAASGAIKTITGNSGGAESPTAGGNFNVVGTGSITVAGSANTETVQLTGLTNHAVLVGAGTATITKVGPSSTTGAPLLSEGSTTDPAFSTTFVVNDAALFAQESASIAPGAPQIIVSNTSTTAGASARFAINAAAQGVHSDAYILYDLGGTSLSSWEMGAQGTGGSAGNTLFILQYNPANANAYMDGTTVWQSDTSGNTTSTGQVTAKGDGGGLASSNSLTGTSSTTIGAGTGTVKMSSGNNANNAAWIKIYIGTTAYWIPAWTTNSP